LGQGLGPEWLFQNQTWGKLDISNFLVSGYLDILKKMVFGYLDISTFLDSWTIQEL